jgi:hypothetical protein
MRIGGVFSTLVLVGSLSACALSRSEIDVPYQSSTQPESGVAVTIVAVDARRFEAAPASPSTPSLKESSQIADPQITSRAVARKRNGYGAALGDVLLMPPKTVASLVSDAVKAGLRDSGYRVLEPSDAGYAAASKINVRIAEFWTWVTPGFASIKLDGVANLAIEGDLPPIRTPATVSVSDTKGHGIILESDWGPFITTTLIKIRDQVRSIMSPKTAAASQPG